MNGFFWRDRIATAANSPESREYRASRILDECLEEIRTGQSTIADCLARYPADAAELGPLLQFADAVTDLSNVRPSREFKQRTRALFVAADSPAKVSSLDGIPPKVIVGATILLLTFAAVFGTLSASAASLPGSALYSVKRGIERLELVLASDYESRASAHLYFAEQRLAETQALAQAGDSERAELTSIEYRDEVSSALASFRARPEGLAPASARSLSERLSRYRTELLNVVSRVPASCQGALDRAIGYSQSAIDEIDSR